MSFKDRALRVAQSAWDVMPVSARRRVLFLTNHHFLVGVVGLIHDDRGRVLLLEHRFRTPWRWGLPGGFIERGEELGEALARELREEVGIDATVDDPIFDTEHNSEGGYVSMTLTGSAVDPPEVVTTSQRMEIVGGGFYGPDDLPEGVYPYHRRLLAKYFAKVATDLDS